jgi:hypothetical protein
MRGFTYRNPPVNLSPLKVYGPTQPSQQTSKLFFEKQKQNKLRGLYFASELYRLSNHHLLARFNANFCG